MEVDHTYWYLNRAAGFIAYLLLFGSVALGLTMTGGLLERFLARYRLYDLHRFLSLLGLGATAFHILIVLPDRFVRFSIVELLVPFTSPYEPFFVALGIFSLYLVAVIVAAFYARRLVSYHSWRLLHYTTFAAFWLALAHGAGAGTDTEARWAQYLYAATGLVAFNLLVYRSLRGSSRPGLAKAALPRTAGAGPSSEPGRRRIRDSIERRDLNART